MEPKFGNFKKKNPIILKKFILTLKCLSSFEILPKKGYCALIYPLTTDNYSQIRLKYLKLL